MGKTESVFNIFHNLGANSHKPKKLTDKTQVFSSSVKVLVRIWTLLTPMLRFGSELRIIGLDSVFVLEFYFICKFSTWTEVKAGRCKICLC